MPRKYVKQSDQTRKLHEEKQYFKTKQGRLHAYLQAQTFLEKYVFKHNLPMSKGLARFFDENPRILERIAILSKAGFTDLGHVLGYQGETLMPIWDPEAGKYVLNQKISGGGRPFRQKITELTPNVFAKMRPGVKVAADPVIGNKFYKMKKEKREKVTEMGGVVYILEEDLIPYFTTIIGHIDASLGGTGPIVLSTPKEGDEEYYTLSGIYWDNRFMKIHNTLKKLIEIGKIDKLQKVLLGAEDVEKKVSLFYEQNKEAGSIVVESEKGIRFATPLMNQFEYARRVLLKISDEEKKKRNKIIEEEVPQIAQTPTVKIPEAFNKERFAKLTAAQQRQAIAAYEEKLRQEAILRKLGL